MQPESVFYSVIESASQALKSADQQMTQNSYTPEKRSKVRHSGKWVV